MPPELPSGLPELHPAVIDEITARLVDPLARRVVEVMHEQGLVQPRPKAEVWLNAAELARRLGVSREWVYEHADELGARRIGSGPRPRLRFPGPGRDLPRDGSGGANGRKDPIRPQRQPEGLIPIDDE